MLNIFYKIKRQHVYVGGLYVLNDIIDKRTTSSDSLVYQTFDESKYCNSKYVSPD